MQKEIKVIDKENGIVRITCPDERWYVKPSIDKKTGLPEYQFMPSVTWICGFYPKGVAFFKWLANKGWNEAEAIKEAAGNKGSKVHQAITQYLLGEEIKMNDKFINSETGELEELKVEDYDCIVAFHNWLGSLEDKLEVISNEIVVFNDKENYAGTIDLLCRIGKETWLIDFKTGQTIWPEYELQLSAYKHADLGEVKVDKLGILQIGYKRNKNGYKFNELEDKFELFEAAKKIWANETEGQKPAQKDYPLSVKIAGIEKIRKVK